MSGITNENVIEKEHLKYKMVGEWIFIKPDEPEKEKGGIIIPETLRQDIVKGIVKYVNGEKGDRNIKTGDLILYKSSANSPSRKITLDGEDLIKMKKSEVLGIMFGDDACDVTPLRNLVFLSWEIATDEYGKSGLIRPEAFKKMHYTGTVIAKGIDCKEVEVEDRVFFDQFPNDRGIDTKLEEDGKRYTIIAEDYILCKDLEKREVINV